MRVISLLPSATELLFAIGAGEEVVGITHECDFPPEAQALPRLTRDLLDHGGQTSAAIDRHIRAALHRGSSLYALDDELLATLRPDLVVTQELCQVCAVAYQEVAAAARRIDGDLPVLSLEPRSLDDILGTVTLLGETTGHEPDANRLVAELHRRLLAVEALPPPRSEPRVVCLEWTDPLMVGGHWVPEMVRRAGGRDVLGIEGEPSRCVEWAEVVAAQPDLLVLMPCGFDLERTLERAAEVTDREGFGALLCSRTGRTVAVDGSAYFNRPGPRILDGLEILAAAVRRDPDEALPRGAAWLRPA
jgi:iron complex transport system substrate-binding protein